MSRVSEISVRMIERSISDIGRSAYPSSEYTLGMVELAYRHGHISEAEQVGYTQDAFNAVAERRRVLRREDAAQRMEQVLERMERLAS